MGHIGSLVLAVLLFVQCIVCAPMCGSDLTKNFTVTETSVTGNIAEVLWLSQQEIFLRTDRQIVYHSQDGGKTWENIITTLGIITGGVVSIYSSADSSHVYLVGMIEKSTDPTSIWTFNSVTDTYRQQTMQPIGLLQPHPTDPVVSMMYTSNNELYITKNQFLDVVLVDINASYGYWGSEHNYYYVIPTGRNDFSLKMTNFGAEPTPLFENIRSFTSVGDMFFVGMAMQEDNSLQLMSRAIGKGSWVKARFPNPLPQYSYSILDVSDGSIVLFVEHSDPTRGNLYMSDTADANFVLVLRDVVRQSTGDVECRLIDVDGVMLANQYIGKNDTQTLISFDNGGKWQPLTPPGGCTTEADCSVQLHMSDKRDDMPWGPFHTRESAVGLILGTGNVGSALNGSLYGISTFFSRTAGVQWTSIAPHSTTYEFADHGALMVVADNVNPTNMIRYSWNEMMNFVECQFSETEVRVEDILVEPTATSQSFLLHGLRTDETTALVHLDFSDLHERECTSADYEEWSVLGNNCLLGQIVTYTRRKQTSECYNPLDYEQETKTTICPCTQWDYECDYCFESRDGACERVCDFPDSSKSCEGTYTDNKGYRLVPGTVCDVSRGLDLLPKEVPCQEDKGRKTEGMTGTIVAVVVSLSIFVVAAVVGTVVWRSRRMREWLEDRVTRGRYSMVGRKDDSLLINDDEDWDSAMDLDADAPILNDEAIINFSEDSSPVK